jgi:mono/diheme cytochrome c family protein
MPLRLAIPAVAAPLAVLAPCSVAAGGHGAAVYAEHCAACHGARLEGQPEWQTPKPDGSFPAPPHDETGHTWHHGDRLLADYIARGGAAVLAEAGVTGFVSAMPAFGELLDAEDIAAVLAYIKSTWPPHIQEIQRARTAAEAFEGN